MYPIRLMAMLTALRAPSKHHDYSSHVSSESSDPNRDQNDRYEDIVQGGYPVGREGTRIVPMKTISVHETLLGFEMARTFAL